VLLAHLLSAELAGPQHKGLDWHTISILQQVEAHLKQYAALQCSGTNFTSSTNNSSSSDTGAACGEALAAAVRHLLPHEAYTLDQVRR
jgi:Holliday junction resolvasome RuvABC endonuclease subunit